MSLCNYEYSEDILICTRCEYSSTNYFLSCLLESCNWVPSRLAPLRAPRLRDVDTMLRMLLLAIMPCAAAASRSTYPGKPRRHPASCSAKAPHAQLQTVPVRRGFLKEVPMHGQGPMGAGAELLCCEQLRTHSGARSLSFYPAVLAAPKCPWPSLLPLERLAKPGVHF